MRLHMIALGCQMSAADGLEMAQPLLGRGFSSAASVEQADAVVISTCTVRQHAEDRALSLIGSLRPWKEADPSRVLIVAGCAAQRLEKWMTRRFPYVDLVVGAKSIEQFPAIVEQALGWRFDALREQRQAFGGAQTVQAPCAESVIAPLTIMRGCNYSCSYCIVPSVRGRELYRPVETILEEARRKIAQGAKEFLLLGQTVNSYAAPHQGREAGFGDLLRLLDALPGVERLRFMSPHPYYADDAMLSAMAECRSVCEFLHLPVQSGSDAVLKRMRRNYTRDSFLNVTARARKAVAGIVFSTDIIVGFPGETEEDFKRTLGLVEELAPASAYCFKYSPREGTESAGWPDDVPQELKEERLARLNEVVERLTQSALKAQIGHSVEVLNETGRFGRTRDGFKARWKKPAPPGTLVTVRAVSATRRTLLGETDEP